MFDPIIKFLTLSQMHFSYYRRQMDESIRLIDFKFKARDLASNFIIMSVYREGKIVASNYPLGSIYVNPPDYLNILLNLFFSLYLQTYAVM